MSTVNAETLRREIAKLKAEQRDLLEKKRGASPIKILSPGFDSLVLVFGLVSCLLGGIWAGMSILEEGYGRRHIEGERHAVSQRSHRIARQTNAANCR